MSFPTGSPFHGEFSSSDATALTEGNARLALYGPTGTAALTLDANDVVQVLAFAVSSAATNATVTIYDGADATADAGETVFSGVVTTNTTLTQHLPLPHYCQKGTYPKVKASAAGAVLVQVHGTVYRHGA